jgi:hypothetical protein
MTPQNPAVSNSSRNHADARWIFDGGSASRFHLGDFSLLIDVTPVSSRFDAAAMPTRCAKKRSPRLNFSSARRGYCPR